MSPRFVTAIVDEAGTPIQSGGDGEIAWWSLTKTAIAALALRLAEAGRLELDRSLPGAPYSLRHLLNHMAGLPDYGASASYQAAVAADEAPWSDEELLSRLLDGRSQPAPGRAWRTSNLGYLLARRRIEEHVGMGLGDALRTHVLEPLGLSRTRMAETRADMAGLLLAPPHPYHPGWVFHGTLIGPVGEAALFLHRLLEPGFLSADALGELCAAHPVDPSLAASYWHAPAYGLGLMTGRWTAPPGQKFEVAGHGAGGHGSHGATFRVARAGRSATIGVYASEGENAEGAVLRQALETLERTKGHHPLSARKAIC
ncbi:serine hydrolase domain-containing protein [Aureimonas sp. ME7]|uniref:serine hydrolase domain-containing protein n=1 Tax=Aureimonas sp. ME7 TaxID=2744252 RepID=UPI0015F687CB|nr:serine hydrolase domain-containing protein [Aureimonas sp. ME7]